MDLSDFLRSLVLIGLAINATIAPFIVWKYVGVWRHQTREYAMLPMHVTLLAIREIMLSSLFFTLLFISFDTPIGWEYIVFAISTLIGVVGNVVIVRHVIRKGDRFQAKKEVERATVQRLVGEALEDEIEVQEREGEEGDEEGSTEDLENGGISDLS